VWSADAGAWLDWESNAQLGFDPLDNPSTALLAVGLEAVEFRG